ncbi:MAG: transporter substrate-binding domain-containing protein [Dysgonomonas sp.]|nr:transporter substrate-binding domain-containing protein [Dysgonomonas sp.]
MLKKKVYIIFLVAVVVLALSWILLTIDKRPDQTRDYPQIEASAVLNIVTDYNSVGYFVSGDTLAGFNHDLIQLLQLQVPFKIEVQLEAGLNKSIEGLKAGKYDILARNIPITSEMRDSLSFTDPVAQNRQVLVQRKKTYNDEIEPLRSHLNLAKKTLYVPANSPAILRIRNLSHEIGDTIFIKEDSIYGSEQLIMKVAAKEIDYAVCDEKIASRVAQSLPEIDHSTLIGFTHLEAWAVNSQSPILLDSLNVWIRRIKDTPEYDKLYKRYYK